MCAFCGGVCHAALGEGAGVRLYFRASRAGDWGWWGGGVVVAPAKHTIHSSGYF